MKHLIFVFYMLSRFEVTCSRLTAVLQNLKFSPPNFRGRGEKFSKVYVFSLDRTSFLYTNSVAIRWRTTRSIVSKSGLKPTNKMVLILGRNIIVAASRPLHAAGGSTIGNSKPQGSDLPKPFARSIIAHSATVPSYNMALIITSIKLINPSYFTIVCHHPGWLCYHCNVSCICLLYTSPSPRD